MASSRFMMRSARIAVSSRRTFTTSTHRFNVNDRANDTAEEHRKIQKEKPLNPHMTNTTSTIANEMPNVGKDKAPPELVSSVDGEYVPQDGVPENTERMTGGTQEGGPESGTKKDLKVGEIEGGKFKIEPLRRVGEDVDTTRARLLYQSRKRGTAESDLLMSTFAHDNLPSMTSAQLEQYDRFLDEDDWDIYYWATQEPSPTSMETAEGAGPALATPAAVGKSPVAPASGEWAQTVGTFKPADRPVPQRWKDSEILSLLRQHVKSRSSGGVLEGTAKVGGQSLSQSVEGTGGGGLGFMPRLNNDARA